MLLFKGIWSTKDVQFARSAAIEHFAVMHFCRSNELSVNTESVSATTIEHFTHNLANACRKKGMRVKIQNQLQIHTYLDCARADVEQAFRSVLSTSAHPTQLFLVFLPSRRDPLYAQVKFVTETIFGIPSQCIDVNKLRDKRRVGSAYHESVALKINAKLGGYNHSMQSKHPIGAFRRPLDLPTFMQTTNTLVYSRRCNS
jgi:eukaryotic translation initiation factor 2C